MDKMYPVATSSAWNILAVRNFRFVRRVACSAATASREPQSRPTRISFIRSPNAFNIPNCLLRIPLASLKRAMSSSNARLAQQLSHLSNPTELTSAACCAVPASADFKVDNNYAGKGKDITIGGFKAYLTGKAGT
jgi:hypothetical protein